VQASTSYLTHYLSEKLSDLELKGFISYKHAFFKRVSCFNSENQSESDLNDLKMNYFCPKSEIIKDYCSEIQTVDEMICIESAMNKGLDFYESKDSCQLNKVN
jgi:hypothetical protein